MRLKCQWRLDREGIVEYTVMIVICSEMGSNCRVLNGRVRI